jgi:hypothetical protein
MGTGVGHRLLGLSLPPVVFCAIDAVVTLVGQSAAYWAGQYHFVMEGSPTPYHLLQIHPLAFVLGILAWMAMFSAVILLLPDFLALVVSIVVTFGHTAGAATWVWWRFAYGYQWCLGLFLAASVILGTGVYWGWQARPAQQHPLSNWSPILRWTLIVLLFGVAVYLFLWPRRP